MSGTPWPRPTKLKRWTDSTGVVWRRVGDEHLSLKAARRAFRDPDVEVVRFCGVDPVAVSDAAERSELWSRIEPLLRSKRAEDPFHDMVVVRFRNEDGRSMLAVEEYY